MTGKIILYDTTLQDGARRESLFRGRQTQDRSKARSVRFDYIEGGWPAPIQGQQSSFREPRR